MREGDEVTIVYDRNTDNGLGWMHHERNTPVTGIVNQLMTHDRFGEIVFITYNSSQGSDQNYWTYQSWCHPRTGPW